MGEKIGGCLFKLDGHDFLFLGMFGKIQINFAGKQTATRNTRHHVFETSGRVYYLRYLNIFTDIPKYQSKLSKSAMVSL